MSRRRRRPGEVVYADAAHVLCRRWNWRQDARSLITPQTARAVVTVQANGAGDVAAGADDLVDLIGKFCGGQCRVAILDQPAAAPTCRPSPTLPRISGSSVALRGLRLPFALT